MIAFRRWHAGRGSEKGQIEHGRGDALVDWYRRLAWRKPPGELYLELNSPVFPPLKKPLIIFLLLIFVPIAASAARYFWLGDGRGNWQTADRSSSGLLPPATPCPDANFFGRVDEHEADKHSDADGYGSAPVVP